MDNVAKYGISIEFQKALKGLQSFKKNMNSFNDGQVKALQTQITLQKQLNKLRTDANKVPPSEPKQTRKPSAPRQPKVPDVEAARRRQAVKDLTAPTGAGDMKSFYKAQEREAAKTARAAERQEKALNKAKQDVKDSLRYMGSQSKALDYNFKATVQQRLETAKTGQEVRKIVKEERARLRLMEKQGFASKRLQSSTEQLAGNFVSAFAIAGTGSFITKTGQDLESVSNTILAVSTDAEEAGSNLGFVRDQARRLGLDLTEASRGFAKMVSARGEMSLEDTKEAFMGISEMSTLIGLSPAESGRAINALQQMMSKGVVSAEELKLQMGKTLLI